MLVKFHDYVIEEVTLPQLQNVIIIIIIKKIENFGKKVYTVWYKECI
jgi:hypothetical protein